MALDGRIANVPNKCVPGFSKTFKSIRNSPTFSGYRVLIGGYYFFFFITPDGGGRLAAVRAGGRALSGCGAAVSIVVEGGGGGAEWGRVLGAVCWKERVGILISRIPSS